MFKRPILLFGLLLLGGLLACQAPTPTSEPVATSLTAVPTPEPTDTPSLVQPSPEPEDTPSPTLTSSEDGPSPASTPPWQIPQIRESDWVRGGADAGLTIVEYSDFQ